MDTFLTIVQPILEALVSIALTVLVPLAGAALWKYFGKLGLDVDQKHRDAFQTAIERAAMTAVSKMGGPGMATTISNAAIDEAVSQVKASVPDAIKHFDVTTQAIVDRVKPAAEAIVQTTPNIVAATGSEAAAILARMTEQGA